MIIAFESMLLLSFGILHIEWKPVHFFLVPASYGAHSIPCQLANNDKQQDTIRQQEKDKSLAALLRVSGSLPLVCFLKLRLYADHGQ